jgi:CheY-like chemotaxis protein
MFSFNIFSSFKKLFNKNKTLSNAIKKIIGRAKFEALTLSCSDDRQWIDAGAVLSGKSVEDFIDLVAAKINLTPIHVVPKSSEIDLDKKQQYLQAGCCLMRKDQILLGIITCNPERTAKLVPEFNGVPKYLSSWKLIKSALDSITVTESSYEPFEKLFDIVQTYNAVELKICSTKFTYQIQTSVGQKATGAINPDTMDSIISSINSRINLENNTLKYQEQLFAFEKEGSVYKFSLNKLKSVNLLEHKEDVVKKVAENEVSIIVEKANEVSSKIVELKSIPTDYARFENPYVLLVDDNQSFTKVVSKYLGSLGIESKVLNNGQEAFDFLTTNNIPAVVVCDLHMPIKNGFDVVRLLRSDSKFINTAIIMLTSDQDVEAEIAFLELGVEAFIKKNQDPRILTTQIKRLIAQRAKLNTEAAA